MTVVGLVGLMGAGKSTVAEVLVKQHGFIRVAFADALRDEVAYAIACVDRDGSDGRDREAENIELMRDPSTKQQFRLILQGWGSDFRRTSDPDYWVRKLYDRLKRLAPDARVVVDDCRFLNEAAVLRGFGARLYRIHRHGNSNDTHESETEQLGIAVDATLHNTGDNDHGSIVARLIIEDLRTVDLLS